MRDRGFRAVLTSSQKREMETGGSADGVEESEDVLEAVSEVEDPPRGGGSDVGRPDGFGGGGGGGTGGWVCLTGSNKRASAMISIHRLKVYFMLVAS